MAAVFDKKIDAYVPDRLFRKRDPAFATAEEHKSFKALIGRDGVKKRFFSADDFILDPEKGKLVCPAGSISCHAIRVHGITEAMVAEEPNIAEVLPQFIRFVDGAVMVFHNASFDYSFLHAAACAHRLAWPNLTILDTLRLSRKWYPDIPHALGRLAELHLIAH